MCDNLTPYGLEKASGYKVVAEKNGRYYSPAMGIRYHDGKLVKIPKKQNRITTNFDRDILKTFSSGFSELMIGRTAIFISRKDAENTADWLKTYVRTGYTIRIVSATVSDSLVLGNYGPDVTVVAGKRITFQE